MMQLILCSSFSIVLLCFLHFCIWQFFFLSFLSSTTSKSLCYIITICSYSPIQIKDIPWKKNLLEMVGHLVKTHMLWCSPPSLQNTYSDPLPNCQQHRACEAIILSLFLMDMGRTPLILFTFHKCYFSEILEHSGAGLLEPLLMPVLRQQWNHLNWSLRVGKQAPAFSITPKPLKVKRIAGRHSLAQEILISY